jgi:hypothetical protein
MTAARHNPTRRALLGAARFIAGDAILCVGRKPSLLGWREDSAFLRKPNTGGFEGGAERGESDGTGRGFLTLEAQDRLAIDLRSSCQVLERPAQRRAGHPALGRL